MPFNAMNMSTSNPSIGVNTVSVRNNASSGQNDTNSIVAIETATGDGGSIGVVGGGYAVASFSFFVVVPSSLIIVDTISLLLALSSLLE